MTDRKPLKYETLKYLGREYKKDGEKKDGSKWKLYKLKFDKGQYGFNVNIFSPLTAKTTLQVDDLKEGEYYNIGYSENEYTHPQFGQQKNKTAVFIKDAKESESTEKVFGDQKAKTVQTTLNKDDLIPKIKTFYEDYRKVLNETGKQPSMINFIGSYILQCGDYDAICAIIEEVYQDLITQTEEENVL